MESAYRVWLMTLALLQVVRTEPGKRTARYSQSQNPTGITHGRFVMIPPRRHARRALGGQGIGSATAVTVPLSDREHFTGSVGREYFHPPHGSLV
jgi:hypothetical protein